MPVLKNKRGDKIDVGCGGFGGDNVLGTVEEKDGTLVVGAKVTISNQSKAGEVADDTTNGQGKFDKDVDAEAGNLIAVTATWKDGNGRRHTVSGTFRCPKAEEEHAAVRPEVDRAAMIARLEDLIEENLAFVAGRQALLNGLHEQLDWLVNDDLNAVARLEDRDQQKESIDKSIVREVRELENKFESARAGGGVPPSDLQWAILQEMFNLIKKLITKAFILQELPPPEFRPGPGGDGPGGITSA